MQPEIKFNTESMGGKESKMIKTSFSAKDTESLKVLYEKLLDSKKTVTLEGFSKYFSMLPSGFRNNFYEWIISNGSYSDSKPGFTFNSFILSCEALLNSFGSYIKISKYQNLKATEMLLSILNIKGGATIPQTLTPELLSEFILTILFIVYPLETSVKTPNISVLLQRIFKVVPVDTKEALYDLNALFPSLNKILGIKLRALIFNRDGYLKEPHFQLSATSRILSNRLDLLLLPLIIPQVPVAAKLQRLYIASEDGFSFNRLANSIRYYNASFVMIFRHIDRLTKTEHLFGVYNEGEAKDALKFASGNVSNAIFSLTPKIFASRTYGGKGDHNYCYFNTRRIDNSDYKKGLGFGGTFKKARLWIDGDFPDSCYLESRDDTYELKLFLDSPELNIEELELWGLGNEENLVHQQGMVGMDIKLAEQSKKVDKKAFLQGDFNKEYLLGKTFGHRKDEH